MIKTLEEIMTMLDKPNMNPLEATCQRKFVRAIVAKWAPDQFSGQNRFLIFGQETNQLDLQRGLCTGEQGKCGCMHAEPKLVLRMLQHQHLDREYIMFCNYSPCDPCANLIGFSGLFRLVVWKQFATNWPNAPQRLHSFKVPYLQCEDNYLADNVDRGNTIEELTKFLR